MGSRELYRRFVSLCKKWPLDETKPGRDLGEFIRIQIGKNFPMGEMGPVLEPVQLDKQLSALERLANNTYANKKPDLRKASASGLELDNCREVISTKGLEDMQKEQEQTVLDRLRESLNIAWKSEQEGEQDNNNNKDKQQK